MKKIHTSRHNYNDPRYITCKACEYTHTCPRFDECSFLLSHKRTNVTSSKSIRHFREAVSPTIAGKLKTGKRDLYASSDSKEPIYFYHRGIINDALDIIRKGGTAYVYTEQALKDVLKLEPKATVDTQDGIYYMKIC